MAETMVQFTQDEIKESDTGDSEAARKMNENHLCVCQRPEGVPNNSIMANLELPRGRAVLIWLNSPA